MNTHHSFGLFVTFRLKFELVAPMVVVAIHGTLFTNCIASLFLFSVFELSWFCCSNAGVALCYVCLLVLFQFQLPTFSTLQKTLLGERSDLDRTQSSALQGVFSAIL